MDNNFDRLQEANNNVDSVIEKVWKQAEENLNKMKPKSIQIKNDSSLRHTPSSNQIEFYNRNCDDLEQHQISTMDDGCEQEVISDEAEITPMADIRRIAQQAMKEKGLTFEDVMKSTHEAQQKYRKTLDRLSKVDVKPIPKTQIGMNKRQKEIMKSFVGKYPLKISLSDVYEPDEDDMTEFMKKRGYTIYEE